MELEKVTVQAAMTVRAVGVLDEMETICAAPVSVTWVRRGCESGPFFDEPSFEDGRATVCEKRRRCESKGFANAGVVVRTRL